MTGTVVFWLIVAVLVIVLLYLIGIYNALVGLRNQVKNAWSQIDVQLKRRHDLIPNLVETAKGYMKHERETFENVTRARADATGARGVPQIAQAESRLTEAISRFMAVVENYPELKANENFLALQEELSSTENRIAFARQAYNDAVLFLNNKIEMFPSSIIANMFTFSREAFFEMEDASERTAPKVSFS
ncbi:MAG TPA: LemA family protein [Deltaproteobacteria bacterium]|nr:LemA family protein [Deltaproteobacteria bacterium]HPR56187.1 LemA family protein [Deltaproteobacteria bacterium]HXK46438.1 LemA family protein [Deltaproteobacteria bacterium]